MRRRDKFLKGCEKNRIHRAGPIKVIWSNAKGGVRLVALVESIELVAVSPFYKSAP